VLYPHPVQRHQWRKRFDLLDLGSVVVLLGEDRHVGPTALHQGVVCAEIAPEAETWHADNDPPPAKLRKECRWCRHDCGWTVHYADPTKEAPTWFMNVTGSTAPKKLLSPLR
jgi:hypothetical protein